ncbi:MAG TPA: hypothetical protein VMY88_01820 [Acidimicrobiales bacterium]|nr:hypothetical protein [Acidimicrobiales bacterium]
MRRFPAAALVLTVGGVPRAEWSIAMKSQSPAVPPTALLSALIVCAALALGACGDEMLSAAERQDRFCELASDREAQQPDLDPERATPEEVKAALGDYVERVRENLDEAMKVAPEAIRGDFAQSVEDTRRVSQTGDLAGFGTPAMQHVGEYLEQNCK